MVKSRLLYEGTSKIPLHELANLLDLPTTWNRYDPECFQRITRTRSKDARWLLSETPYFYGINRNASGNSWKTKVFPRWKGDKKEKSLILKVYGPLGLSISDWEYNLIDKGNYTSIRVVWSDKRSFLFRAISDYLTSTNNREMRNTANVTYFFNELQKGEL